MRRHLPPVWLCVPRWCQNNNQFDIDYFYIPYSIIHVVFIHMKFSFRLVCLINGKFTLVRVYYVNLNGIELDILDVGVFHSIISTTIWTRLEKSNDLPNYIFLTDFFRCIIHRLWRNLFLEEFFCVSRGYHNSFWKTYFFPNMLFVYIFSGCVSSADNSVIYWNWRNVQKTAFQKIDVL